MQRVCPPASDTLGSRESLFWDPLKRSDIQWNFEKFLLDTSGKPWFRFDPDTNPRELEAFISEIYRHDNTK